MCAHWQSEYDASPCSYCAADQENAERVQRERVKFQQQLQEALDTVTRLEMKIEHMQSLAKSAHEIRMELVKLTNQNFDEVRAALAASTKLLHNYSYVAICLEDQVRKNEQLLARFPSK